MDLRLALENESAGTDNTEQTVVADSTGTPLDTSNGTEALELEAAVIDESIQKAENETEQLDISASTVSDLADEVRAKIDPEPDIEGEEKPEEEESTADSSGADTANEDDADKDEPKDKEVAQEQFFMQTTLAHAMRCVGVTEMLACESNSDLQQYLSVTEESLKEAALSGVTKIAQMVMHLISTILDRNRQFIAKLKTLKGKLKSSAIVEINDDNRNAVQLDDSAIVEPDVVIDMADEYKKLTQEFVTRAMISEGVTPFDADTTKLEQVITRAQKQAQDELIRKHRKTLTMGQKLDIKMSPEQMASRMYTLVGIAETLKGWLQKAADKLSRLKPQRTDNNDSSSVLGKRNYEVWYVRAIAAARKMLTDIYSTLRMGWFWLTLSAKVDKTLGAGNA